MKRLSGIVHLALRLLPVAFLALGCSTPRRAVTKQQSLDEWRTLTSPAAPPPRVFVKANQAQFYFPATPGVEVFKAQWTRGRIRTSGYRVRSAVLRWDRKLSKVPREESSWREAVVIAGAEWRSLATNLIEELTPATPNHAAYYQVFLSDGVCYRDPAGGARFLALHEQPTNAVVEHQYSIEETLELFARFVDRRLGHTHSTNTLFVLMAPSAKRFAQPVLVDRWQQRCVLLNPAALYDYTEQGLTAASAARSLRAVLPESHGVALLKNPVSSAARLLDLGIATLTKLIRLPLPKPGQAIAPAEHPPGMDLVEWENWLDRYTGTKLEEGALALRINGDGFFPGFEEALARATNHIHFNIYIFDRDDVGVKIADLLKGQSTNIEVKVMYDRLGSIGAGQVPPASPLPEDFNAPAAIGAYLKQGSSVQVRKFLNPWFSSDHSKVLLVDGGTAWLGGMNFGREYRYDWHDLMVEVHGPVVGSLEDEFRRAWAHAGPFGDAGYLAALLSTPSERPVPAKQDWMKVRLLPTRTLWKPFSTAILNGLEKAQNHIYVENPYLFDKRVILALVNARHRGVDVRVVLPMVNDFKAAGRGNLVVANYLLENGVAVYFFPGMTHVKAVMIDNWVCLGSANLNHLSLRLNQEQNVATSDPRFAAEVRSRIFEEDFKRSHPLTQPIAIGWLDLLADLLFEGL